MPTNIEELEGVFYATRADLDARIGMLEADVREEPIRVMNTVTEQISEPKYQFEVLSNNVNAVLLKLQECARREDLVDDMGGALDEFIESFVVH